MKEESAERRPESPRIGVALPAAGLGRRMGGARKPLLELSGEPVLLWALRPFLALDRVVAVTVAMVPEEAADPPEWLTAEDERIRVVEGGETRRDSVWHALRALPEELDVIAVHDAARPLLDGDTLDRCIRVAVGGEGAVAGIPAADTLKRVDGRGFIQGTPDRSHFWQAQTPQVFPAADLREAYRRALAEGWPATDDASLVEKLGRPVRMVESSARNMKLTRPEDVILAEALLSEFR